MSSGVDGADSPRRANGPLASPAGRHVSVPGGAAAIKIRYGSGSVELKKTKPLLLLFLTLRRWQCYSSHHRTQRVCYSLLLRLLTAVDAEWDPTAVRGDLVGSQYGPTTTKTFILWKLSPHWLSPSLTCNKDFFWGVQPNVVDAVTEGVLPVSRRGSCQTASGCTRSTACA